MFPAACIHGRFQILHNDHYSYFERAAKKYERLYIGLTGQRRDLVGRAHRDGAAENPLTYWERAEMWRRLLRALGQAGDHIIGPFPIEAPAALADFVPRACVCATTLRDNWNEEKIARLRNAGYRIDVLPHNAVRPLSATELRKMIASGDARWRQLVPAAVAEFLDELDIQSRLLNRD